MALALGACGQPGVASTAKPPQSPPASPPHAAHAASPEIVAVYREAASLFEVVDNASAWYPDKNDAEYREHALGALGFGQAELALLERWAEVRRRTAPPATEGGSSLLGRDKPRDVLAACFHGENELAAALSCVEAALGRDVASTARQVFEGLLPRLAPMVSEGRALIPIAAALEQRLREPRVSDFVARMARFYRAGAAPRVAVVFVWWPPVESMGARLSGDTVLMRYHPDKHGDEARRDVDVVMHEIAHVVSRRQPEAQKAALSAAFVARCDAASRLAPARVLEEPLAVVHQKMFVAEVSPERFDRSRSWYGDPWVSVMAKLVFDATVQAHAQGRSLDEPLVKAAARGCHELLGVARSLPR